MNSIFKVEERIRYENMSYSVKQEFKHFVFLDFPLYYLNLKSFLLLEVRRKLHQKHEKL